MLANHKQGHFRVRGIRVDLERGQLGYSILTLSARWGWSRGKINRYLNELETVQQIVQQKTKLTTLISIVNYDKYQNGDTTNGTTDDTTDGQQTDINKNDNNEKKESNAEKPPSPRRKKACQIPDDFDITTKTFDWLVVQGFKICRDNLHPIEHQKFINYSKAKGTKYIDWQAAWRNWMIKAEQYYLERQKQR